MDPISAVSLASNVIQFVDFGCKLVSQSRQLYKSADANATLSDKIHVEVITLDLISLTTNIHASLPQTSSDDLAEEKGTSWDDEMALVDLSERCQGIAQCLLLQLNKLKVRSGSAHKSWEAFKAALRSSWKREEMELLATQLSEIRAEIEFRVLLNFRKSIKTIVHQQSQTSHQLANCTQSIITTFLQCRDELAIELQKQAEKLVHIQGYQERVVLEKHGTFQTLQHQDEDEGISREHHTTANDMLLEQEMVLLMVENAILGSLDFASIRDRHEDLESAHHQTFQWVYKASTPSDGEKDWSNFVEWLQKDTGYYWISGKAGSGKSTLMKYICNNVETQRHLRNWAGSSEYHMSSYFFWNSGTDDQRSQKGLLRTLLFETLQTHRELIPKVFPVGWEYWSAKVKTALKLGTVPSKSSLLSHQIKSWSLSELKRGFGTLVRECQKRDVKLCFFVDGLDEYESSSFEGDHDDLAEYFLGLSKEPGLKMCLSSRPLVVFEEAFTGRPGLKLQNLTRGDISHYVEDKLGNHRHMKRLSLTNPDQARSLVREIVNKASGVFLWVKLVVRSLLQGLRDSNRVSDLQKRLKHLPADLEALYDHMLRKTEPFYLEQASQIFQIVLTAQRESSKHQITLLQLSWAEDEDEQLAITTSLQSLSDEQVISRCRQMDIRLKSVCSGLLESYESKYSNIAPDARVVCMHRTVSDFFKKPSVWAEIVKRTAGMKFCPHLSLLRSSILQLKSLKASRFVPMDMSIVRDALQYAKRTEDDLEEGFPALLDQLDAAASYQWRLSNGRCIFGKIDQSADAEGDGRITAPLDISPSHDRIDASSSAESDYYDCRSSGEYELDISQATPKAKQIIIGSPPPHKPSGLSISLGRAYKSTKRIEIDNAEINTEMSVPDGITVPGLTHWTYGIEIPGVKLYHHVMLFYDLAALLGLRHYLADKNVSGLVVDHDVNHHILIHHVGKYTRPKKADESQVPDPTTVQVALEAGADPNLSFHGDSAWEVVLAGILSHLSRFEFDEELWDTSSVLSQTWQSEAKTWSEVMRIFLQHGANPVASSKQYFGQPRRKPLAIIRLLPPSLVDEAEELGRLINRMIEKQNPKGPEVIQEEKSHRRSKSEPQRNSSQTISWVFSWFGIRQKDETISR